MDNFDNVFSQVINADMPALIMFYKPGDPRCVEEAPRMHQAAKDLEGYAHFMEVNCETHPELKARYHIHAYPTFAVFRDGQETWRAEGRIPKYEPESMLRRFR